MSRFEIIAIGRMKAGPQLELWQDYARRISWPLALCELEGKSTDEEQRKLLGKIDPKAFVIVMDERGRTLSSVELAGVVGDRQRDGVSLIQCVIGGADGVGDALRARADLLLSFGRLTWPHMLARVMLIEQIYRAQQILAGHPYHRAG